jgi:hypothetical protein
MPKEITSQTGQLLRVEKPGNRFHGEGQAGSTVKFVGLRCCLFVFFFLLSLYTKSL